MASRLLAPFVGGRGLSAADPFLELNREVNRLFDTFRNVGGGSGDSLMTVPNMDVHETDDGLEVTAEIPGVDQKDIDLRLEGDVLTIRGEKRKEHKDEQARVLERSYGSFVRSIQLPYAPDPDKVSADCDRGLLRIRLPKGQEQERSRRIQIGSGQALEGRTGQDQRSAIGQDWSGSASGGAAPQATSPQGSTTAKK